jgi:hypothetical protein
LTRCPVHAYIPGMANIGQRIIDSLDKLVTLQIVTAVGPTVLDKETGEPNLGSGDEVRVMVTRIRLLEGDVFNKMDDTFVTGVYSPLRSFHEQQVDRGLQIVKDNITALGALYDLLRRVSAAEPQKAPPG